jgi:hypothetical protein
VTGVVAFSVGELFLFIRHMLLSAKVVIVGWLWCCAPALQWCVVDWYHCCAYWADQVSCMLQFWPGVGVVYMGEWLLAACVFQNGLLIDA